MKLLSNLLLILLIAGCTRGGGPSANSTVVQVDEEILTARALGEQLASKMKHYDAAAAKLTSNVNRAKQDIIQDFLVAHIVKKYAKQNNIEISDDEFEKEFSKIRNGYKGDLAFKSSLASSGLLVVEWKKNFRNSLLQKKVFAHITAGTDFKKFNLNEDAKKYYLSHLSTYQHPAEIRLSQIVVAKAEEAEKIQKFLRSNAYTFQEMAKKYSLSPDSQSGGDIGYISRGAVPDFDVAFNLPVGQLSGIIRSSYGYHLMKVTAKRGAYKTSFEQARPEIVKMLEEQKKQEVFAQWVIENLKSTKVEKNQALVDKIKVYTQGAKE